MIDIAQLTEQSFRAIMGRIHVLLKMKGAVRLACGCLDMLINKRLAPIENDDWLSQAFVFRVWITVQDKAQEGNSVEDLKSLLDKLVKQLSKPLGKSATHAAQILLWKASESFYLQKKYDQSSIWCRIALHKVFDRSGELNHAKISRWVCQHVRSDIMAATDNNRRVLMCAIQVNDFGMAAETFNDMPEATQNAPLTRLLMFKVALRTEDEDLGE